MTKWTELEEGYGLSRRAIKLLGFDQPCQCGHEEGLHNEFGECVVLECNCLKFAADGETASRKPSGNDCNNTESPDGRDPSPF